MAELERVIEVLPATSACRTVDVSRVEASAIALDTMTGLSLSDRVDWRNPLIDRVEVQRAVDQWRRWFDREGDHLALARVVAAIDRSGRG